MNSTLTIIVCILFASVPAALCYTGRWLLDRGRTEPPWIFPVMMVMGGLGGVLFALAPIPELELLVHNEEILWTAQIFAQPALEEFGKACILLPFLLTPYFRSPVDGFFYGFAAGSGFAVCENFIYFFVAYEMDGGSALVISILTRLGPSCVIHGGATAIVGAYLGGATWSNRKRYRFLIAIPGLIVAIALHSAWNVLINLSVSLPEQEYLTWAYLLLTGLTLGLVGLLYLALRLEARLFETSLRREVDSGRMTTGEVNMMADPIARRQRHWLPAEAARTEFVRAARSLAYSLRKADETGQEGHTAEFHRERVRAARSQEPEALPPESTDRTD